MLSRFISRSTARRHLSLLSRTFSSHLHTPPPPPSPALASSPSTSNLSHPLSSLRFFSAGSGNGDDDDNNRKSTPDTWSLTSENDDLGVFGNFDDDSKGSEGKKEVSGPSWADQREESSAEGDIFQQVEKSDQDSWSAPDGVHGDRELEPWNLGGEEKVEDVFAIAEETEAATKAARALREEEEEKKRSEQLAVLQKEEAALTAVLKGPTRAFGDLLAASGISDAMLDSLMALKSFGDLEGLPPLAEIEDMRYKKSFKDTSKAEEERLKQEEIAKARVRKVDDRGRAYGTGRRKCSVARVWVQPGTGKFIVNEKEFDVYFPTLDHRATLLRPFTETKTLGLWDVKCTTKGGGSSGQVGAIRLGLSRALQNWEPGLRPPLRKAGFLTRDPRVVERKKPGRAKARKRFQWVKR